MLDSISIKLRSSIKLIAFSFAIPTFHSALPNCISSVYIGEADAHHVFSIVKVKRFAVGYVYQFLHFSHLFTLFFHLCFYYITHERACQHARCARAIKRTARSRVMLLAENLHFGKSASIAFDWSNADTG